jgi:acetate kinase
MTADRAPGTASVLAINPGSSSLKAVLRDPATLLTITIDRLGTNQAQWTMAEAGQDPVSEPFAGDLPAAVTHLAELLHRRGLTPDAVAHRVVHGGPLYDRATVITDTVLDALAELVAWAPLHLPGDLASINAARTAWPDTTHIACFDTAFHRTLPDEARRLALPDRVDQLGVRRYGFHGLSVQSIVDAVPDLGDATIAHLGSGCSVTAVHNGHSVHTSMSLTPTGGVMSATRSGDLDPEIPLLLLGQPDATVDTVRTMLDRDSGLAGIADGAHDVRDLLTARDHNPAADFAMRVFTRNVAMAVAAAATALPQWDTLVFTAGIGEHARDIRDEICQRLCSLRHPPSAGRVAGVAPVLDSQQPAEAGSAALTATGLRVLTVPADEAAVMDRQARSVLATAR